MCAVIKPYNYFFKYTKLLPALIGFLLIGCQSIPDKARIALKKSESNRVELEKVIQHYKNLGSTRS